MQQCFYMYSMFFKSKATLVFGFGLRAKFFVFKIDFITTPFDTLLIFLSFESIRLISISIFSPAFIRDSNFLRTKSSLGFLLFFFFFERMDLPILLCSSIVIFLFAFFLLTQ
uniref:Uncharacterized protein n=1 Tax=Euplotes harpa TaxID=151035 RepID=A0A7S3JBY5_9SPIT